MALVRRCCLNASCQRKLLAERNRHRWRWDRCAGGIFARGIAVWCIPDAYLYMQFIGIVRRTYDLPATGHVVAANGKRDITGKIWQNSSYRQWRPVYRLVAAAEPHCYQLVCRMRYAGTISLHGNGWWIFLCVKSGRMSLLRRLPVLITQSIHGF